MHASFAFLMRCAVGGRIHELETSSDERKKTCDLRANYQSYSTERTYKPTDQVSSSRRTESLIRAATGQPPKRPAMPQVLIIPNTCTLRSILFFYSYAFNFRLIHSRLFGYHSQPHGDSSKCDVYWCPSYTLLCAKRDDADSRR